jgi:outer membrane protein OmpU
MMKKLLLGSTALAVGGLVAAPAMAADPIKMGVGGYYQFYALAGSMEGTYATNGTSAQFKGIQFIQEGEIHFIGQTKLDNGTSVGVRVELEGWNPPGGSSSNPGLNRQIDEAYLFAFGDWGRVEFGAKDDAAYIMYYGAPSALLGFGFFQHNSSFSWTNPIANANNKAAFRISAQTIDAQFQDVNRINYYTPRFFGLQIGVGYAPKINLSSTAAGAQALVAGPGANTAGQCGFNDATTANGCPTNDYSWQDALSIGANYLNKFGDFSVAAYVAYSYASFVPGFQPLASAANTITGANLSAWKQFVAGLQFSAYGFTLGGSYTWDNNGLGSNYYTGQNNDTNSFAVGLMYETGPWQFSAGAAVAYNNNGNGSLTVTNCNVSAACSVTQPATFAAAFGSNPQAGALRFGTETASKIEVGANYALGPGVKVMGGVVVNNLQGPSNAVAAQSWAALLGMDFRF